MSEELKEVIINGKRYVLEKDSRHIEGTVRGWVNMSLGERHASRSGSSVIFSDAVILEDLSDSKRMYSLPVGTRIRITVVSGDKEDE